MLQEQDKVQLKKILKDVYQFFFYLLPHVVKMIPDQMQQVPVKNTRVIYLTLTTYIFNILLLRYGKLFNLFCLPYVTLLLKKQLILHQLVM